MRRNNRSAQASAPSATKKKNKSKSKPETPFDKIEKQLPTWAINLIFLLFLGVVFASIFTAYYHFNRKYAFDEYFDNRLAMDMDRVDKLMKNMTVMTKVLSESVFAEKWEKIEGEKTSNKDNHNPYVCHCSFPFYGALSLPFSFFTESLPASFLPSLLEERGLGEKYSSLEEKAEECNRYVYTLGKRNGPAGVVIRQTLEICKIKETEEESGNQEGLKSGKGTEVAKEDGYATNGGVLILQHSEYIGGNNFIRVLFKLFSSMIYEYSFELHRYLYMAYKYAKLSTK